MVWIRTPSIVGIKNCALWSSVVPAVHQLAYRPNVQQVIDLTRGYTKALYQRIYFISIRWTYLGIIQRLNQVWY